MTGGLQGSQGMLVELLNMTAYYDWRSAWPTRYAGRAAQSD